MTSEIGRVNINPTPSFFSSFSFSSYWTNVGKTVSKVLYISSKIYDVAQTAGQIAKVALSTGWTLTKEAAAPVIPLLINEAIRKCLFTFIEKTEYAEFGLGVSLIVTGIAVNTISHRRLKAAWDEKLKNDFPRVVPKTRKRSITYKKAKQLDVEEKDDFVFRYRKSLFVISSMVSMSCCLIGLYYMGSSTKKLIDLQAEIRQVDEYPLKNLLSKIKQCPSAKEVLTMVNQKKGGPLNFRITQEPKEYNPFTHTCYVSINDSEEPQLQKLTSQIAQSYYRDQQLQMVSEIDQGVMGEKKFVKTLVDLGEAIKTLQTRMVHFCILKKDWPSSMALLDPIEIGLEIQKMRTMNGIDKEEHWNAYVNQRISSLHEDYKSVLKGEQNARGELVKQDTENYVKQWKEKYKSYYCAKHPNSSEC
jgi:hypothetical protein